MTREEIKDELYRMLSDVVNGGYPKRNNTQRGRYREAVKKAIKALEQEPCDDAISRQAAIDACLSGWNKDYKEIVEEIRTLPPVTPQYTEAEIQKMQELEFAEIQKAYEIGKAENIEVLDKIKAEIVHLHDWAFSREEILRIIDKYKASPTGEEGR